MSAEKRRNFTQKALQAIGDDPAGLTKSLEQTALTVMALLGDFNCQPGSTGLF